jgi:vacuolar-type H+-ATPase subunit C/Vma6
MTAYLKGQEARIITSEHFSRLSKVASIQDAILEIRDTTIGSYLEGLDITNFNDLDASLWKYFGESLRYLQWFRLLPKDVSILLKTYSVKYDVANIKAVLQSISTGKKATMIPVGEIADRGLLDELGAARDIESIVKVLNECKLRDYAKVVEGYQAGGDSKAWLVVDTGLGNLFYRSLKKTTRKLGDASILTKAISAMIGMTNLQTIMRAIIEGTTIQALDYLIKGGADISDETAGELLSCKLNELPARLEGTLYGEAVQEIVTEYEKTNNISVIAEVMGKHSFKIAREMLSIKLLSSVTALWYVILKESEVRSLRLTLKAVFDNIPLEEIRKLVVFAA